MWSWLLGGGVMTVRRYLAIPGFLTFGGFAFSGSHFESNAAAAQESPTVGWLVNRAR
jgi:hypothetical protein